MSEFVCCILWDFAGLIDKGIKALREFMQSIYGASGNDGLDL